MESSNAQTHKDRNGKDEDEAACYCCGDKSCRFWRCGKHDKIPHKDWYKPEFAPKPGKKNNDAKVESHTYNIRCQPGTTMEFSEAQCVKVIDPFEECLDSGSTITLSKREDEMENVRDVEGNVIMLTNAGENGLDKEGD